MRAAGGFQRNFRAAERTLFGGGSGNRFFRLFQTIQFVNQFNQQENTKGHNQETDYRV